MAKQLPKQLEAALAWSKSNALAVVFCAIVVVVPVGAYLAADWWGSDVREQLAKRADLLSRLNAAKNSKIEIALPGEAPLSLDGLAGPELQEEYTAIMDRAKGDSLAVFAVAREFNGGTATRPKHPAVVDAKVFPAYDARNAVVSDGVRSKVADALAAAYAKLLTKTRAGSPPEASKVADALGAEEKRFVQGEFRVDSRGKLDPAQTVLLQTRLGKFRMAQYADVAKNISMYADLSAFDVPSRDSVKGLYKANDGNNKQKQCDAQDLALFELEWKYWIASDVMNAFAQANSRSPSVQQAAVKRVIRIAILPSESTAAATTGEASAMGGETPAVDGVVPDEGVAPANTTVAAVSPALGSPIIDSRQTVTRDYAKRYTGRVSNGVYDVRLADVTFVAATSRLPQVFDALANQNFMTVTNVRLVPADAFAAARDGFVYGAEPVSTVTATIETIWMRDWTAQHMPAATRTALGITSSTPESSAAPAEPVNQGS